MQDLHEIKRRNACIDPDDDWRDSEKPIVPASIAGLTRGKSPIPHILDDIRRLNQAAPRILEPPPMYKYVKETFCVPATWWDHLKITIRSWALWHLSHRGFNAVCWLFKNIKSTRIPVVYEIHAAPKITRRGAK